MKYPPIRRGCHALHARSSSGPNGTLPSLFTHTIPRRAKELEPTRSTQTDWGPRRSIQCSADAEPLSWGERPPAGRCGQSCAGGCTLLVNSTHGEHLAHLRGRAFARGQSGKHVGDGPPAFHQRGGGVSTRAPGSRAQAGGVSSVDRGCRIRAASRRGNGGCRPVSPPSWPSSMPRRHSLRNSGRHASSLGMSGMW